jgi:transcriptional regulator of acetoin/glycerol metabolism
VAAGSGGDADIDPLRSTPARLRDTESDLICRAVVAACTNVADAARQLGISRATIYRRLTHGRRR